ncbi:MAG: hypothetical protein OXE76_15105 [Alphaproteobacteria bacterium]|nr:hypothetical protein [Alphaproteobacteria bacterium]
MEIFKQIWTWIGNEVASFGVRWLFVGVAVLGFGGWIGKRYHDLKQQVADLRAANGQPTQVIVQPGAAYNDFRGAQGTFHVHLPGPSEVVSDKPIRVIELEHEEKIVASDSLEAVLTTPDGRTETRSGKDRQS